MKEDAIKFFKTIGFIQICDKEDLSCGPQEVIDIYNEKCIELEELAKKYELYDEKQAAMDPWYDLYTLWPEMNKFFLGDGNMNNTTYKELKEIDEESIRQHFTSDVSRNWNFDQGLEIWFEEKTSQDIRQYLLDNIDLFLSPDVHEDFVNDILFHDNFDEVIECLSNVELLTAVVNKREDENGYNTTIWDYKFEISRKEWRKIVDEATNRFVLKRE